MPEAQLGSLFALKPVPKDGELFETLHEQGGITIRRIQSSGTQPPCQYCQSEDEWVLLLKGTANVRVCDNVVAMSAGQYLFLPRNEPHEVLSTSENAVWLAIHMRGELPVSHLP